MPLPVPWHAAGRSGHGLVERVVVRRSKDRTVEELLRRVIPEPVLARLEALGDRMVITGGMATRMLRWRRVAAADMPASRTAPEMEPPAVGGEALHAPGATRRRIEIDVVDVRHRPIVRDAATGRLRQ